MTTRDRLLGLTVVVLWGLNFIAIRLGLDHFPPFLLGALRFGVMAIPVMLFVKFPTVHKGWFLLYGLGFGVAQFALLFLAMNLGMPTGLASLVLQSSAPFTVLLGVFFLRERMSKTQLAGILVAVGGMAVIAADRMNHGATAALVPVLLTLLAGLGWAFGNIGGRLATPSNALNMVLWMSVIPPLPMLAMSLIIDGPDADFHSLATLFTRSGMLALAGLAYIVILGTIAGSGVWSYLLTKYPASRVAPLSLLVPIVGISASWAIFDERPTLVELLGAVIVIIGCAAGLLAKRGDDGVTHPPRDLASRRTDQSHIVETMDHSARTLEGHRDAGRTQRVRVGDALVAQRIESGDDDVRGRQAREVVGKQG
ncbi:putative amino acid efflux protein [Gordonia effusa NBRC 100432]|uniref:Putative amino acid efflux protein n=1 Tax=Gordonia effusa NBRC 100432 TaxID=1077974 RepID=H0R1E7_9ACTN|nr:EamA family transporter [Gordonia effusa]GAB18898.1 putative amino acid efflux protein [Gordonia effusa NBRC 100432]